MPSKPLKIERRSAKVVSEHQIQCSFFAAISYFDHPAVKLTFAVPNQAVALLKSTGKRTMFVNEGVRGGVPDILCLFPSRGLHGLAIEMKNEGGRLSQAQREFLNLVHLAGYKAVVCYSFEQALEEWKEYLGI